MERSALRVMIDRPDAVIAEERWENAFQDFAISDHVRNAAGYAKIVFEHGEGAIGQTHEISAADADVDITRDVEAAHFTAKMLATVEEIARNNFVGKNAALVIDVAQKKI